MSQPKKSPADPANEEQEGVVGALEHLVGLKSSAGDEFQPPQAHPQDTIVGLSAQHNAVTPASQALASHKRSWWRSFFPSDERVDELFAEEHMGNYVVVRSSRREVFESMPIYVRVVERLLETASVHQGKVYDDATNPEEVLNHISSFVSTYSIPLNELLEPDLKRYPTFNSFFFRKLRPDARPIAEAQDTSIISSSADCRLTVFRNVTEATQIWIKGKHFSLQALLGDVHTANSAFPPGSSLAVFRLAPADYHRYHSPVGPAVTGPIKHLKGAYLTVNPEAVNQDFDVFTGNRRDVLYSTWNVGTKSFPYALVSVGALLVGSIAWTSPAAAQGSTVQRGDELGYFAYGGSTVIAVFPPEANVQWDQDLLDASTQGKEMMVRVGERVGRAGA